jgi:hypothetical protein
LDQPWVIVTVLGAVIFVFAFLRSKTKGSGAGSADVVRKMEETFEHFAREMEDGNRELLNRLSELKAQYEAQTRELQERIRKLEQELRALKERKPARIIVGRLPKRAAGRSAAADPSASSAPAAGAAPTKQPEPAPAGLPGPVPKAAPEPAAPRIADRYRQVLDWHRQGKSMEYIAKKLGMNKGEVQLILKLSEREASLRAES